MIRYPRANHASVAGVNVSVTYRRCPGVSVSVNGLAEPAIAAA